MPIHDWSNVPAGLFHDFHQQWTSALCDALNAGVLPNGYYALVEQNTVGLIPDVLTLERATHESRPHPEGGVAVAEAPPRTRFVSQADDAASFAARANRIIVRAGKGDVVAALEIVSPGNKNSRHAIHSFVEKTIELLGQGVHLLVIDLFPPSSRDPQGIHKLIWDEIREEDFRLPTDKPLTLAAYVAAVPIRAYAEPVAPGDSLPDMPLFLDADTYVRAPLDRSYEQTWSRCPEAFREQIAPGT